MFQLDIETYSNPFNNNIIETCYTSDFEQTHKYILPKDVLDALNKDFAYYRHPFSELRSIYLAARGLVAEAMMNGSAKISERSTTGRSNNSKIIFDRLRLLKDFFDCELLDNEEKANVNALHWAMYSVTCILEIKRKDTYTS